MCSITNESLMKEVADTDNEEAFEALVSRLNPLLSYLMVKYYGIDKEDIRQEVFFYLWKYRCYYNPAYALTTYVFAILKSRVSYALKMKKRHYPMIINSELYRSTHIEDGEVLSYENIRPHRSPLPPTPADEAMRNERKQISKGLLSRLARRLPAKAVATLEQHFLLDMNKTKIGKSLGFSREAGRLRVNRALLLARHALAPYRHLI